jgi:hypothetical protein
MDFAAVYGPLRKGGAAQEVLRTPEFDRIAALPRRDWQTQDQTQLAEYLEKYLHVYSGPCATPDTCEGCQMRSLRPAQIAALRDCYEYPGAFLPLRPGAGKTAISLLNFTLLKSKRPLLIVPADLQKDTHKRKTELARHWRILPYVEVISYQWLSHKNQSDFMDEYKPDVIFCDECDYLGNTRTVAWKRLKKYLKLYPETRIYLASGTPMGRALREITHLLLATLRDRTPVPRDLNEQIAWGLALDSKVPGERTHPGALLELPGAEGETELTQARRAFRKRLLETPGVVATAGNTPPMHLVIRSIEPEVSETVREAILKLRETRVAPSGLLCKHAIELYGHAKRLGQGLHYYYDPPPPFEWRMARSAWLTWAQKKLSGLRRIDQLSQLQDAILAGDIDDGGLYKRWLEIQPTYEPEAHRKVQWVDDETSFGWASDWVAKHKNGLIWTPDVAWGELAEKKLGIPYFGTMGEDKNGMSIREYRGKFAICSVASVARGRNLQRYQHNLVMSPPSTGKAWTQLLSRTWRDGQEAAEVTCDVILTSRESYGSIIQAIRDSQLDEDGMGGSAALRYAETHLPSVHDLALRNDSLWRELDLGV